MLYHSRQYRIEKIYLSLKSIAATKLALLLTVSSDARKYMLELLEQLFRQVRAYTQSYQFDRNQVYSQTSTHTTMQFDHEAEDIIISGLIESGHGFEVITEERVAFTTMCSTALPHRYRSRRWLNQCHEGHYDCGGSAGGPAHR